MKVNNVKCVELEPKPLTNKIALLAQSHTVPKCSQYFIIESIISVFLSTHNCKKLKKV